MATLRVTFLWEEDDAMSYDTLIDQLMFLGAEDIDSEEYTRPEPEPREHKRKKKH